MLWHAVLLSIVFGHRFHRAADCLWAVALSFAGRRGRCADGGAVLFQYAVSWGDPGLGDGVAGLCPARRLGNVAVPAYVTLGGAVILVPLLAGARSSASVPFRRLALPAPGIAIIVYYALATIVFVALPAVAAQPAAAAGSHDFEWRFVSAIMRVGGLSAIGTIMSNLTVVLVTGSVGLYGTKAIAGYGIASRLDYLLIPLLFGIGSAAVTISAPTSVQDRQSGRVTSRG